MIDVFWSLYKLLIVILIFMIFDILPPPLPRDHQKTPESGETEDGLSEGGEGQRQRIIVDYFAGD
ncbi:MAG: hypothetical protein FH749_06980 [Firmicutes bacterium]|nr:hypothetical protein [Bacillota bacterium]